MNGNFLTQFSIGKLCALSLFVLFFALFSPIYEAVAQPTDVGDDITKTICRAIELLTGNVGRAIAVLIVISLAIALFLGKVTWGLAIAVAVGMGILFGAENVVTLISGGDPQKQICPKTSKPA